MSFDDVSKPEHYNSGDIECIDAIEAASTWEEYQGYLRGNVLKYIWRYRYKDNVKDLRKAMWYLERLIKFIQDGQKSKPLNLDYLQE